MAQVITTILLNDNPKGLRLIEMEGRTGKVFIAPRGKLAELRAREEVGQPGLYFLFGEGKERPSVYIGQSENVIGRLISHDADREEDEWNVAFIFVGSLDSALIKYLESISVDTAKKADRYDISNTAIPRENRLSEAQKIVAFQCFEHIKLVAGLFGYLVFEDSKKQIGGVMYSMKYVTLKGADGHGTLLPTEEFIVYKNSLARKKEQPSFLRNSSKQLKNRLIEDGILKDHDENSYIFTKDYIFTSPSSAGNVIIGGICNGWDTWKDNQGHSLDENVRK
ncbi:MAG: GIY-YIG nuclease family protein [Patescibacteria group bacterium]|nr:GIY-YIG nuclease family protein [Patescibacteria group bacterium]